ncbi:hypothetical protein [Microbacterium imperiale]|nr:hypothetical protein [Microbacterium imperiale]MBP2419668.1 hypothetical protein [Microbacterium imperiale]MDS0198466.1 hypothetical protein [Microbacterium imperiale]
MTAPQLQVGGAMEFVEICRSFDVEPPAALVRGLELLDIADEFRDDRPLPRLLDLAPEEVGPLITDLSIRRHAGSGALNPDGLATGASAFAEKLLAEMREATLPELDRIVSDLRPRFDELAKPLLVAAQEHGFTSATTSDDVITQSPAAIEAWRALRHAEAALEPIADVWRSMTTIFAVEPTRSTLPTAHQHNSQHSVNFSVCFAAGENWSLDEGFVTSQYRSHLDWLAIAARGLRLNSPTEVGEKIATRDRQQRAAAVAAAEANRADRDAENAAFAAALDAAPSAAAIARVGRG